MVSIRLVAGQLVSRIETLKRVRTVPFWQDIFSWHCKMYDLNRSLMHSLPVLVVPDTYCTTDSYVWFVGDKENNL